MTDWIARGPDDFGDFTISSQGEELAKCVVVQNGFRTPKETKAIAEQLIKAVNNHDALVKALEEIKTCALCGFSLNGKESFSQLGDLISKFNSELQKRVQIAERALAAVGQAGSRS